MQRTDNVSIGDLRSAVEGPVIGLDDRDYDDARGIFYGGFEARPAAIVRVTGARDVSRVVALACETGAELAVRGGGHSVAGHSTTEGGIVLDLRDLKRLDLDVEGRTAWAETGLTAGEYTVAAAEHGLATGFGDTGSVGIGGITLGGGVGYLVRKHGLTIDSLIAAEVVTADGELRQVDEEHEPDLFWAIRGGGGNFGVVTRFRFRLHPVDHVVGGMLLLPATPEVVAAFVELAEAAPEELSTIANVMPAPPMPFIAPEHHGELVVLGLTAFVGPVEEGQRALAPFRALAEPLADMLRPIRYPELYPPEEEEYHPTAASHTMFMDRVGTAQAETILEALQASDAPLRAVQLRALGGAMARVPADATAFAHRSSRIMTNVASFYVGPEDRPRREAWVVDLAAKLRQDDAGAYVNFMGVDGPGRIRQAYPGATWDRLVEIKRRYDPDNVFRRNQNVPPTG